MTTFNENTSLFEIKKRFQNIKTTSVLNFEQWIDHGNIGKIHLHVNVMDQVKELLKYLNITYKCDDYSGEEIEIGEYHAKTIVKKHLFLKNKAIEKNIWVYHFRISKYENYINIRVNKKYFDVAEKISREIVNYIGYDCHIRLKS